ncbi:NCS2 family permease, partial [Planococcus sp. SIMBA_143]
GIFFGILIAAVVGMIFHVISLPTAIIALNVPSLAPTFGVALDPIFNEPGSLMTIQFLVIVLAFLFVDFFHTDGTL